MKVLHVINALGMGGGAEHSLATMLPRLRDRGVHSSVVCMIPREGGLQASLREQGFQVDVLPARTWGGRVRAMRRAIRAASPDLIHATLLTSCLVTRAAAVGLGVPQVNSLVNTTYDPVRTTQLGIRRWKLGLLRIADGVSARRLADHFHAISHAVRQEAVEVLGIDPKRVTVIPRGRSAESLGERSAERRRAARQRLGLGEDVPVLLNVGRQDHQKAQDQLIRAFARLRSERPDAVLLIAGREGAATPGIRRALEETGVGDAVRLLGHRSDVADLYVASDVFVFPSLFEGLGCSLIEAMALATPIIGSDAEAVSEVLGGGEYGILVPRGDDAGLALAMARLLADPQLRQDLARRGHERYREVYDLERVTDSMLEMYRAVLSDGKHGR
jgi:glycosyltransferase involved in cell wall biosynthesis